MRVLDPTVKAIMVEAANIYGGPGAGALIGLTEGAVERYLARHGAVSAVRKTREQIRGELEQMIAEELPDVGERPDAVAAGEPEG